MVFKGILLALAIFFLFPLTAHAADNQFITIVNPVRISSYSSDPVASLKAQYKIISERNLPATWLFTYDAFEYPGIKEVIDTFKNQEVGIFLEITEKLATKAGINYKKPDYWYHPNSLFTSGYDQTDRKKLIDAVFNTFKDKYGYYPTSVGAWWIDSFSLEYLREHYGVIANLNCSDQFSTDNYKIWGQYWSQPFYPTKFHAGIPAGDISTKIDMVTVQWAPRDPLHGYVSSLYSTQDYFQLKETNSIEYFEKLVRLYGGKQNNSFGQVVVGLEGDFVPQTYDHQFKAQMDIVSELTKGNEFRATTMNAFSSWYRNSFSTTPPMHVKADDLLGSGTRVEWYQTSKFRLGLSYKPNTNEVTLFDFRVYSQNFLEPYYYSPNRQINLAIYTPAVVDSVSRNEERWTIPISREELQLGEDGLVINKVVPIPEHIRTSKLLTIKNETSSVSISPNQWPWSPEGLRVQDLTPEVSHLLTSKKLVVIFIVLVIVLAILLVKYKKIALILTSVIFFAALVIFLRLGKETYIVTPGELQALTKLYSLPGGTVLVPSTECLQCEYHTGLKPAVFVNSRSYVGKVSNKKVIFSQSLLRTPREEAKEYIAQSGADYVYLTKIEGYKEELPHSPGDWGLNKIFENANAEIWMRENKTN